MLALSGETFSRTVALPDNKGNRQLVELKLGESKDIFFDEERMGLRFKVAKIGPDRDSKVAKAIDTYVQVPFRSFGTNNK